MRLKKTLRPSIEVPRDRQPRFQVGLDPFWAHLQRMTRFRRYLFVAACNREGPLSTEGV
jgi:hypothetical protein